MSEAFPFIGSTVTVSDATDDLPTFKEYAWDFDNDCFKYDEYGGHILLTKNDALEVWIYKALMTERFSYLAYSWQYGIELKPFIGKVMGVQERKSELRRVIVECLMVNPYIKSIDKVEFEEENRGNTLTVKLTLTTIYGELVVYV